MISTDRKIFEEKSAVRARQIEYATKYDEVHIIVFQKKQMDEAGPGDFVKSIQIAPNCRVYSTSSKSKYLYPFDAIKIGRSIIRKNEITEITCQDASLTAMAGVALKKQFHIPLEIQIHEDLGSPYYTFNITNKIRKYLSQKYIPQADKIRVVSKRIKSYVQSLLDEAKVNSTVRTAGGSDHFVISDIEIRPIEVDEEFIKQARVTIDLSLKYPQFEKIVLMASRLEKEKNIGLAIEAWSRVVKAMPKAGLVIVGEGSQISNIKNQISKMGLSHSVILEDWADRATLISYYKTCSLFLNTSLFEGYGLTLVEAQIAGCPIISTDVGVAKEVGAIITEYDPEDLAHKIISLLKAS